AFVSGLKIRFPGNADLGSKRFGSSRHSMPASSMIDQYAQNGYGQHRTEHDVDRFQCIAVPHGTMASARSSPRWAFPSRNSRYSRHRCQRKIEDRDRWSVTSQTLLSHPEPFAVQSYEPAAPLEQ